ncbi:uncharacterized protein BYT42DRAFT_560105 [Radiomyces spectabilis]|uniref:uncharacterized protein n=1 Tax=Radiomyces spectabilis TaxID=64574 RepID=UPI00221F5BDD|nr:uncharacterized protein BYT42DRAFT_560105 [Radiomyces spectabilis]KAI8388447.1 hypothetical protein BYT42DRAFT_560105 [Radiomyces spectabilis]
MKNRLIILMNEASRVAPLGLLFALLARLEAAADAGAGIDAAWDSLVFGGSVASAAVGLLAGRTPACADRDILEDAFVKEYGVLDMSFFIKLLSYFINS